MLTNCLWKFELLVIWEVESEGKLRLSFLLFEYEGTIGFAEILWLRHIIKIGDAVWDLQDLGFPTF